MDSPFAPMTPAQENELVDLLADGRGRNTRNTLRRHLAGTTQEEAARRIADLRGESAPPERRLDMEPAPAPANPAAVREATRQRLDAAYAGFAMCHSRR